MPTIIGRLDDARGSGVDVTADLYPYPAGSTLLHTLLPTWINAGGIDALLGRLEDMESRRLVARQVNEGIPGWQNFVGAIGWENVVVAGAPPPPPPPRPAPAAPPPPPPARNNPFLICLESGAAGKSGGIWGLRLCQQKKKRVRLTRQRCW